MPPRPEEPTFGDVPADHWAYRHIEHAVAGSIVSGYGDGNYHPDWDVTRAQMSVFVSRAIVEPTGDEGLASYEPPETASFSDVAADHWCYGNGEYLAGAAVVGGYTDGTYHPTWQVARDQMAVYIARAFGLVM